MARKHKHPEHVNNERWLVSYADFITLLFAFFVVMFAVSQVDSAKVGRFQESFSEAVGLEPGDGAGIMGHAGDAMMPASGTTKGGKKPDEFDVGGGPTESLSAELKNLQESLAMKAAAAAKDAGAVGKDSGANGKDAGKDGKDAGKDGKDAGKEDAADLAGLELLQRRSELVLRMSDNVLFDSGDDKLKERAVRVLHLVAEEIRERNVALRVEGHTDDIPIKNARFRSNWELSTSRATAVIAQLSEVERIPPDRLAAAGYGEFHPVGSNETPEGRAQNRRVDLVISNHVAVSEFPLK